MATDLRTALDALLVELDSHETWDQPDDIQQKWLEQTLRAQHLSNRLRDETSAQVSSKLKEATLALRNADYADPASVRAALEKVRRALDDLEALLR